MLIFEKNTMSKAVIFVVLIQIVYIYAQHEKYVIENKRTGMVVERVVGGHRMAEWDNTDKQLWILEPRNNSRSISGYIIRNVASGTFIQCNVGGSRYFIWKVNTSGDTRIEIKHPNMFVTQENGFLMCMYDYDSHENEKWLFIEQSKKINMKFVIENKKTGKVLEETDATLKMREWEDRDSQLWTLKSQNRSGYSIVNVASGTILTCSQNGKEYEVWKLLTHDDTWIQVAPLNVFLVDKNGKPVFMRSNQNDGSDKWLLTELETKRKNKKPKRVYVEDYQEKFAIENRKTGEILEEVDDTLKMGEWEDRDSQLWTLKSQNRSGYSIVNVASGTILTYFKNGTGYEVWKLKTDGDTWIQVEQHKIFLANKNGKPVFARNQQNDQSDKWLLVERGSKNVNTKKRYYVEDYQDKFVLESKKTGTVLEEVNGTLKMGEWENRDSQLWNLETHDSGYSIINFATGRTLTYNKNNTDYQKWKLVASKGNTWFRVEDSNIFLTNNDGEPVFIENNPSDETDSWIIVEEAVKKVNTKPRQTYVKGHQKKFVIENTKTGEILEEVDATLKIGEWENKDSQLWTLKLENYGYSIANVASGRVLAYSKNGIEYGTWKLNISDDTWIQIQQLNVYLANKNGKPVFVGNTQSDGSDKWKLVERKFKKVSTKPKLIQVEDYQEKFVIENKQTRMVLDAPQQYLDLRDWEDKDSQLWVLEPQNKSGYFIIRNVANRGALTYTCKNGTDYHVWKLNIQGEMWIQVGDADIFLADRDGIIVLVENKQDDESDRWLLIEETSKRMNAKPKPIYVEAQRSVDSS